MSIKTKILPADHPGALKETSAILLAGGTAAFPTDTVYGLGASIKHRNAIDQLYLVKGRERTKAIAVLISSPEELPSVTADIADYAFRLAQRFWPGALTLVLPMHHDLPENLSSRGTIGIRMPDNQIALALLNLTGPLAVTSANLSGKANTITALQVYTQLNGRIQLILDGGETPGGVPSSVVDCTGSSPKIMRQGPLSLDQILAAIA